MMEYLSKQPVAAYVLGKEFPESKSVFNFLSSLNDFTRAENPGLDEYTMVLGRAKNLPSKFLKSVEAVSEALQASILPQLQRTPSMGQFSTPGDEEPAEDDVEDTIVLDDVAAEIPDDETEVDDSRDDDGQNAEEELRKRRISMSRHMAANRTVALELFNRLHDELMTDVSNLWDEFQSRPGFERLMKILWYVEQPVTYDDFNIFRDLGRGAFGVVSGAKFRATGALLALKCMNKKLVKGKKALKLVKAEREVLAKLGENVSNFTVFLQYAFQDKDTFYLALPLCSGGDLQYHLAKDYFFSPERAQFHIAEVVLGVAHMHSLGILYRDLKPDNILLDEEGHCRISDMGLAVVTNGRLLRGRAGTPGYWAPEMLQKKKYSYPVDWWSLGCVLYELLTGRCPFSKLNTDMERDDATLHWEMQFPDVLGFGIGGEKTPFPEEAKDLISKLLNRDRTSRLGSSERGAEEVKEHPYFANIDWVRLGRKELDPVWKPRKEVIHAFNQSDIDGKSNDYEYRKLKLAPEDEIENFHYTSNLKHQEDIVQVLKLEDEGKLAHLDRSESISCCTLQ